jgi:Uma2 family endonuclease
MRRGAMSLFVRARDMLLLAEITSPGNFRQDRIAKHGDYAAAGIPFYLRVDLENGIEALEATVYQLVDGEYREAARSVDGVLRSARPWPFEADLRALATGR